MPVLWKSKRPNICAPSSRVAELVLIVKSQVTIQTVYYHRLLIEMQPSPTHIDNKHFFTREQHRDFKAVQVLCVLTASNKADGMTKALSLTKHTEFRNYIFHREATQQRLSSAFSHRILIAVLRESPKVGTLAQSNETIKYLVTMSNPGLPCSSALSTRRVKQDQLL